MFSKDRQERRGGGVILYIKESIQTYEITLKIKADCEEAILTRFNKIAIPINKFQRARKPLAIREVSRGNLL